MGSEDIVSDLEDILGGGTDKILLNEKVLSIDYVPDRIVGRSNEITDFVKLVKAIDRGAYPENGLLLGGSGFGKSTVVKFVLRKIVERLELKNKLGHPFRWVYIQCNKHRTEIEVIVEIVKQLDYKTKIPSTGWKVGMYYDALWELIREQNISLIVVLDEIDKLNKSELLYTFSRAGEQHQIPEGHFLKTIGISNDFGFEETLDSREKSSLDFKNVIFSAYNAEQIKLILCDRVKLAFHPGAISPETIDLCASISAKVHGDARKAIDLLRAAAIYAEENDYSIVLPEHVDKAFDGIDEDKYEQLSSKMALHDKIVLLSILKNVNQNKPLTNTSEVRKLYEMMCKEIDQPPMKRATVANIIGNFETMNLIKVVGIKMGRGAVGRIFEINVPSGKALEKILYQDDYLEGLEDVKPLPFQN